MPPSSILCSLISATSFFMAHSDVSVEGTEWREPILPWVVAVMPTGSGKSTLFKFLYELVEKVRENAGPRRTDTEDTQWLAGESSIERLGFNMAENGGRLIGIYDELSHFLTQMNILKNKGLTDTQELSTLLQMYNGFPWTRKTGKDCSFF